MNYVALYRKYRPTDFDSVVGQDHIVTTLVNQITTNKVTHAYLFTGTRGTGKTSVAKIFAKAVNCLNPINGNACGKCASCKALSGNNVDIIEMDAASNNGVDYARDIREKVQFAPTNCKYKVYIIDEVHMLSTGAFNALLKTIEEPPAHAIFILCTTEVHKIPATILSRCMRFDFKLIATSKLAQLVSDIFDKEGKKYTKDAIYAIAQAGEGSARDCLSIADRCYSLHNKKLEYSDVLTVLGVSSRQSVLALVTGVLTFSLQSILIELHKQLDEGKDVAKLNRDILQCFQQILFAKTVDNANSVLCLPDEFFAQINQLAGKTTVDKLLFAVDTLSRLELDLKYALTPSVLFEAVLLRIASSSGEVDYVGLDRRVTRLEQQNNAIDADSLVVVDTTDALSIWKGIKTKIIAKNLRLLSACWEEITVSLTGNNYTVSCKPAEYQLINDQYLSTLTELVASVANKILVVKLIDSDSQPTTASQQLSALGSKVTIK